MRNSIQTPPHRSTARALLASRAGLIAALGLAAQLAGATTYTWTNTASGPYNSPSNWDLNAVPGSADIAQLFNGGTATVDSTMNLLLSQAYFGSTADASSGTITMSGGTFSITNNSTGSIFMLGWGANSTGSFNLNGGTLTVARPSTGSKYYQDGFQPGFAVGSTGTITVNNGTLNILCGMEIGIDGVGTLNVNGGTVMDNGWFTVGRGGNYGAGYFNQTGGAVYHLRNPSTDSKVRIQYAKGINGTFSISGGTFCCVGMQLCANSAAGTATVNISGGTLYIGDLGIGSGNFTAGQSQSINISGGTFHTVLMDANANGQGGLSTVHIGGAGTNWTWASANQPVVNLTTSPGPGIVTFAPEAGKTITLNNSWDGPGGMAITGPGTVVFGGTNTYTGGTTLSGGTLQLNLNQPASLLSGLAVSSGATLLVTVPELSSPIGAATFNSGSTLNLGAGAQITDSTLTLPSGVNLAFSANNTQYLPNNVAGAGNVVAALSGNGMEVVTGNLSHTGSTTVSSGILAIGGTLSGSSGVLVTNTGTLAGGGTISVPVVITSTNNPTAAHLRLGNSPMNVPGTLTVNNNLTLGAGSELDVKLGTATTIGSGVNDLLVVQGNLTINPNAFVNVLPMQQLTPGTYVIATYSGTLSGQFTNTVGGLTRYGFSLDYSTPGQIKLNVTGSNANLTWLGTTNTSWDVLTTSNWLNGASVSVFTEGDAVTFDDTSTNHNVVLASALYPASITFNNSSNFSVTGTGSGRITGGTGITKNGTGTVTLAAGLGLGNDYTGPVNLNNGILKMNGALSLGATNGATTVAAGATLDLNGQTPNAEPLFIQGTGFGGTNGAINNSGGQVNLNGGPRNVTLQGDTTLNASGGRWDLGLNTLGAGGGSFAGNGFNLTKNGAQQIWLHELGDIGVGDILVNQGTLGFQYTIGLGNPAKTITVMPSATLGFWHAVNPLSKQVVLTNGATLYSDGEAGSSNVLSGTVTLYGTNTLQVNQALGLLSPMVGTGGFTKTGAGALYLAAANTYAGSTLVNAGSLILGPGGSIANSALIALATNTVLDASQPAGGLVLGSGQTLSGSGTVNGNATAGSGSQIAPGTAVAAGTLTLNNLTLNGGTNLIKLSSDPTNIGNGVNDLITVNGTLTLNGVTTIAINPLGVLNTSSPYVVMLYNSGSASAANFQVVSTSPRYNVSLVDPATTFPYIEVTVTGNPGLLVWQGGAASKPNLWDNVATNWLNLGTGLRDAYFGGDQAVLDDTGTTNTINVGTTTAGSLTLSNNAKPYTLTGSGSLGGMLDMEGTSSLRLAVSNAPLFSTITANSGTLIFDVPSAAVYTNASTISDSGLGQSTLVKAGTNTLVLSAPDNTAFSGALVISNGILRYTNALALGGGGSIYATNTGSLDINAIPSGTKTVVIAGNGFNGQGAVMDSSPNAIANEGVHNLTLVGDAGISASNRWDIYGGSGGTLNGNGYKLTHLGGTVLVNAVGVTGLGDIHVVAGRLGFQGYADMGDSSKTLTIESNAVLTLYDVSPDANKNLVLNGNAIFDAAGNGSGDNFIGPVTLVGTSNLFGLRKNLHLEAAVSGTGGLVAGDSPVGAGTGSLYLDAVNTYTGPTTVNSGHAIVIGANSSLGNSSRIQVNSGGTLDVSAPPSVTLGAGQTLLGAGTITGGSIIVGSGATLAPGFPDSNTYTLTLNGSLTLQAGSTHLVVVKKTTSVANDTVAGLTSVTLGGTLVITNAGNPLAGGDAIQLFSASGGYTGAFSSISPATPGSGLAWDTSTLNSDGKLRVVSSGPPSTPTNIVATVSANHLTLSWPANYTGWTLQGQTNPPSVGISTNWHDVPGSASTNEVILPIDPANGSVFFRMILK